MSFGNLILILILQIEDFLKIDIIFKILYRLECYPDKVCFLSFYFKRFINIQRHYKKTERERERERE